MGWADSGLWLWGTLRLGGARPLGCGHSQSTLAHLSKPEDTM